jgi:cbb3-type cytochrome oxidase subunit 3
MHGKSQNPYKVRRGSGALWFVIFFFILMGGVAGFFYYRHRKLEAEKTITFATNVDETKKRYKDGVEIKPSDSKKEPLNKKTTTAVNESNIEESLDDE